MKLVKDNFEKDIQSKKVIDRLKKDGWQEVKDETKKVKAKDGNNA